MAKPTSPEKSSCLVNPDCGSAKEPGGRGPDASQVKGGGPRETGPFAQVGKKQVAMEQERLML